MDVILVKSASKYYDLLDAHEGMKEYPHDCVSLQDCMRRNGVTLDDTPPIKVVYA